MIDRIEQQLGNYRLVRLLGQGSFADVYLGKHLYLETLAAVKVLRMHLVNNDERGFLNEARIIAHLVHPSIVRVLEFGMEDNTPFLVMNYAPNGSLRERHPKGILLRLPTIVSYIKQVAAALQYAHDQNFIHRNIKPENMLLGRNNEVLLSDFGMAPISQNSRSQSMEEMVGMVAYMAPEQIEGKPCLASDQYSLGVVVYEWLSGTCPFISKDYVGMAAQHLFVSPPPLRDKIPAIPVAIEEVVLRALSKNPSQRFESVQAFAYTLEEAYVVEMAPSSIPTRPLSILTASPNVSPASPVSTNPSRHLSRRAVVASLAGLAVVSGGIALFKHLQELQGPTFGTTATPIPTPTLAHPQLPVGTTLLTYHGHSDNVYDVAWSLDGKYIASWSQDQTMQVWDAITGHTIATHPMWPTVLAWSPDWKHIASWGGGGILQIWDVITGHIIATHDIQTSKDGWVYPLPNTLVTWSPEGRYLASVLDDFTVRVWDVVTGHEVFFYPTPNHDDWGSVGWSHDGKRIAFGSGSPQDSTSHNPIVQVSNITTGSHIFTYHGHSDNVYAVAWSYDGKRIASASADKTVQIWDALTGKHVVACRSHPATIFSNVAWSPDGRCIASLSQSASTMLPTVQIWDATAGTLIYTYHGHSDMVNAIAWSSDGRLIASASADKTVKVWQAT